MGASGLAVYGSKEIAKRIYDDPEEANKWAEGKANGGIASDHNLTIYEICLAYGPTYGQVVTGNNFTPEFFDWFFLLFTPFSDWLLPYKQQVLTGLGWGEEETFQNLPGMVPGFADKQGAGILPRAAASISAAQQQLIEHAQTLKAQRGAKLYMFSHFTMINYNAGISLRSPDCAFSVAVGANGPRLGEDQGTWNQYNFGTCEEGLYKYFTTCVNTPGQVDYHFSGHSHRSGIYTVSVQDYFETYNDDEPDPLPFQQVKVINAFDPGLEPNAPGNRHLSDTRFIVSSSAGPVGIQNLNNEMGRATKIGLTNTVGSTYLTRPPSGTLLDEMSAHPFTQISVPPSLTHPRLSVALDYLDLESRLFSEWTLGLVQPGRFYMDKGLITLSPVIHELNCIDHFVIWFYVVTAGSKDSPETEGSWTSCKMSFQLADASKRLYAVELGEPVQDESQQSACAQQIIDAKKHEQFKAFCEVILKEPEGHEGRFKGNFDVESSWFFPLRIFAYAYDNRLMGLNFYRIPGEKGEVPDWDWLNSVNKGRYPLRGDIIQIGRT